MLECVPAWPLSQFATASRHQAAAGIGVDAAVTPVKAAADHGLGSNEELGGEDSNPQRLDQNQLCYRLHHPRTGVETLAAHLGRPYLEINGAQRW